MRPCHDTARVLMKKALGDQCAAHTLKQNPQVGIHYMGFHAQQAVEKFLKSVLSYRDIVYPKTHDIENLLGVLERHKVPLPNLSSEYARLTPFAVVFRYEDVEDMSADDTQTAIALFERCMADARQWAESFIGPVEASPPPSGPASL